MKDLFKLAGAGFLGAALVIGILCIGPMALIWSINTVFEYSSIGLYIEHALWSYVGAFVFLLCVRGG